MCKWNYLVVIASVILAGCSPTNVSTIQIPTQTFSATSTPAKIETSTPLIVETPTLDAPSEILISTPDRVGQYIGESEVLVDESGVKATIFEKGKAPDDPHTRKSYAYLVDGEWKYDEFVAAYQESSHAVVRGVDISFTVATEASLPDYKVGDKAYPTTVKLNPNMERTDSGLGRDEGLATVISHALYDAYVANCPDENLKAQREAEGYNGFMAKWANAQATGSWEGMEIWVYADDPLNPEYTPQQLQMFVPDAPVEIMAVQPNSTQNLTEDIRPSSARYSSIDNDFGTQIVDGHIRVLLGYDISVRRGNSGQSFTYRVLKALERLSWGKSNQGDGDSDKLVVEDDLLPNDYPKQWKQVVVHKPAFGAGAYQTVFLLEPASDKWDYE